MTEETFNKACQLMQKISCAEIAYGEILPQWSYHRLISDKQREELRAYLQKFVDDIQNKYIGEQKQEFEKL